MNNYNCYAQILISSSNFKTIFISLLIFLLLLSLGTDQFKYALKRDLVNKEMLYTYLIFVVPYIPIIITHILTGFVMYIWYLAGMLGFILLFYCHALKTVKNVEKTVREKDVIIVISLGITFLLVYFLILTTSEMMCYFYQNDEYTGSFRNVFTQRKSKLYFESTFQNFKQVCQFVTYLF